MENDWLSAWKPRTSGNATNFPILKVLDVPIKVRILDDKPYIFGVHWKIINNRMLVCGGESCLFCRKGEQREENTYINVLDRSDGKVKALVMNLCVQIAISNFLREQDERGETNAHPKNYDIKLVGNGKKGSDARVTVEKVPGANKEETFPTSYNFSELVKPLSQEEMAKILAAKAPEVRRPSQDSLVSSEVKTAIEDNDLPF